MNRESGLSLNGMLTDLRERVARITTHGYREFASSRQIARWGVLGILIGIGAGLGTIAFFWLLKTGTHYMLGDLTGYFPPTAVGEGNAAGTSVVRRWALPLVVAGGGLIAGLIVYFLGPNALEKGTDDDAIEAIHHKGGKVDSWITPFKAVASAITMGSGGSAGREGPAGAIGAGWAAFVSDLFHLNAHDRRIMVAAGIGAGIASIFRAPLGGAVLAAEILYVHDMEAEALFPALIASIVGYSIYGSWAGWQPVFGLQRAAGFSNPLALTYYVVLGLICGLFGILYAESLASFKKLWRRVKLPLWLTAAAGGLIVGLIGLAVPETLGTSYGWLQHGMDARVFNFPLWILLILPVVKIFATATTLGSGGSGGIFGPGLVIGGMIGAACWRLTHSYLPGMESSPASFTIVAMMALFGGVAHAPIAVMLMVAEMTGNLSLLAPAMIAVFIATLVVGDRTIYPAQVLTRADSPAHRYRYSFPLLGSLAVRDALNPQRLIVREDLTLSLIEAKLRESGTTGAMVSTDGRHLAGVVTMSDIDRIAPPARDKIDAAGVMTGDPVCADLEMPLDVALDLLATNGVSWMPVIEGRDKLIAGGVSAGGIAEAYRRALRGTVHRLRGITEDTVLLESTVSATSRLAGHELRALKLPPETLVVSIRREGVTILPRGNTRIDQGDRLMVMTSRDEESKVRRYLEMEDQSAAEPSPPKGISGQSG